MEDIAQTIVSQIRALDRRAFMAWGAREFVNMNTGLKFKTSGLVRWKGYVFIKYDHGRDLYDIDFFRIRRADIRYDRQVSGIYAEDLVRIIDQQVG